MNTSNKMRRRKIISRKIVLQLLLALLLFTIVSITITKIILTNKNEASLENDAKRVNATVNRYFTEVNNLNNFIGKKILENGKDDLNYIEGFLREVAVLQGGTDIITSWALYDWVGKEGRQLVNTLNGLNKKPIDMSLMSRSWVGKARPGNLQVAKPVMGVPSKIKVIPAATSMVDKKGRYVGSVTVGISVEKLTDKIEEKIGKSTGFLVIDTENSQVTLKSTNNVEDKDEFLHAVTQLLHLKNYGRKKGKTENAIKIGNMSYNYYIRMEKYPYIILTGYDKDKVSSEVALIYFQGLILLIFIALISRITAQKP